MYLFKVLLSIILGINRKPGFLTHLVNTAMPGRPGRRGGVWVPLNGDGPAEHTGIEHVTPGVLSA